MRILSIISLALLTSACWTPGPGQVDPTRYPWDQRKLDPTLLPIPQPPVVARGKIAPSSSWQTEPQPSPAQGSYCVIAIERESQTGITMSANSNVMVCAAPPNAAPPRPPK